MNAGRIDFDDLFFSRRPYSSLESYQQSKLANVLFSRELARKLRGPDTHFMSRTNTDQKLFKPNSYV